ncbi:MAG: hypothetical protein M1617_03430 [Actinobacteria bacterium]|nr:hypothetical protein [Actinomycetota bacterium]MCL5887341.1 hypothetical protein [Actinomycetota bacterium]
MKRRLKCGIPTSTASDSGYAVVVVMGIIAVLTVVTFGGFAMSRQAIHEASVNRQETQAFQAANGALDAAVARFRHGASAVATAPMIFSAEELVSGSATVTVRPTNPFEYVLTSVGRGADGSQETISMRLWVMDLYGMNIAHSTGVTSAGGKMGGNSTVFGPFYSHGSLRGNAEIGQSVEFGWGPLFVTNGHFIMNNPEKALNASGGNSQRDQVRILYADQGATVPDVAGTTVIRPVPRMIVPRVDEAYLQRAYSDAAAQSRDNVQGHAGGIANDERDQSGRYPGIHAPGASPERYKVVDSDNDVDGDTGLRIDASTPSFGRLTDDFAWDGTNRVLTVRGTVFVDGPLTIAVGSLVSYQGQGTIVANGEIRFENTNFVPLGGLMDGRPEDGVRDGLPHQLFRSEAVIGLATPSSIHLSPSTDSNQQNPYGPPTHAGAFFSNGTISIDKKVLVVGSLITGGMNIVGNNNMDLRTSPNLGEVLSPAMPGHGMNAVSMSGWSRQ